MKDEAIWQAFRDTGEPLCYLLYRAVSARERAQSEETTKTA